MMTQTKAATAGRLRHLLCALALALVSVVYAPAEARIVAPALLTEGPSGAFQMDRTQSEPKLIRLAQRGAPGGRGGGGGGGGSAVPGAVGIGIGILGVINNANRTRPPATRPKKPTARAPKNTTKRTKAVRRAPTIPQFLPNEILVLVASDQPDTFDQELAQSFRLNRIESFPNTLLQGRIIKFRYADNRPLSEVIAALAAAPGVITAQTNNWYHSVGSKTRKKRAPVQYALTKLAVGPAHEIARGRDVQIAVIDTGVDAKHPTLVKSIEKSFDAVAQGKSSAGNHGTAIAGIIAGQGKIKGVAPLSRLLAVRAFYMHREYKKLMTNSSILLKAFDWAYANEARIFNMSFTGPFDPMVKRALSRAFDEGIVLVAAAGNGGPKAPPAYPAAYHGIIAITALDRKDRLYAHANRGDYLAAAAPGVDVLVPSLKKSYRYSSGTSLAAAHVSGLIALLLERHPEASAEAILDAIQRSAHDLGPKGHDVQFGAGRADAHASLMTLAGTQ